MRFGDTLWDVFQRKDISRRSFLKTCVTLTGILGRGPNMVAKVGEAAETKVLTPVIWLHGHECTGCDESFLRSETPLASDLLLNMISLEYNDVIGAAAGEPLEHHLAETVKKYAGKYILAIEGAIPLADDGISCMVGGRPVKDLVKEVSKGAMAVLEIGSCATWGGIQAAKPNPTDSRSSSEVLSGGRAVIKIPGCPPIPEVITGTIMHIALFGTLPPVDAKGRPKQFFGNRIHDTCYRRPFFDSGMFVENFDDKGSKAGWCLYKVGCRGPVTYNSCGNMRWWNGLSYPIQSGSPCIGCAEPSFWDNDPLFARLPNIPVPNTLATADKVGLAAAGVAVAGVAAHAIASVIQQKKASHDDQDE